MPHVVVSNVGFQDELLKDRGCVMWEGARCALVKMDAVVRRAGVT